MRQGHRTHRVIDEPADMARAFAGDTAGEIVEEGVEEDAVDLLEQAREEARRQGHQEGRELGEQELRTEIDRFREEMTRSLRHLAELEQSLTRHHEQLLMQVALEAASRIVRERIDDGDPVAVRAVREAMRALPGDSLLRTRMHPDDVGSASELLRAELELGRIELIADETISRGGARVESSSGTVDVTLEAAEEALRAAVVGEAS